MGLVHDADSTAAAIRSPRRYWSLLTGLGSGASDPLLASETTYRRHGTMDRTCRLATVARTAIAEPIVAARPRAGGADDRRRAVLGPAEPPGWAAAPCHRRRPDPAARAGVPRSRRAAAFGWQASGNGGVVGNGDPQLEPDRADAAGRSLLPLVPSRRLDALGSVAAMRQRAIEPRCSISPPPNGGAGPMPRAAWTVAVLPVFRSRR
jgi:hypothetical protein